MTVSITRKIDARDKILQKTHKLARSALECFKKAPGWVELTNIHSNTARHVAFGSLIFGRIVYAINWFSLAAVFSLTAAELNQNVSGLGLATSAFYLAVGIFQVPGGILAAKIGPRQTVIYGTFVASLAALFTGFAANLWEIVILRFFVGVGMAFVFAPAIILTTKLLKKDSAGLGVGLYNSAFHVGTIIGLSGWASLAITIGWRYSVITGGSLGIFSSIILLFSLPKDEQRSTFKLDFGHLKSILLNKWLIALSIALISFQIGTTLVGNFMAYYLKNATNLSIEASGVIASLASVSALITAPISGRLYDSSTHPKLLMLESGILMTLAIGVAFLNTVYSAILSGILVGVASGAGFTFGYCAAREAKKVDIEYETLTVSWVNGISLMGDFFPPLLFSYFVMQYGYSLSWLYLAILAFVLNFPMLFTKASRHK